jgi:hypothetical protein
MLSFRRLCDIVSSGIDKVVQVFNKHTIDRARESLGNDFSRPVREKIENDIQAPNDKERPQK